LISPISKLTKNKSLKSENKNSYIEDGIAIYPQASSETLLLPQGI
jgi:hypothetical protein